MPCTGCIKPQASGMMLNRNSESAWFFVPKSWKYDQSKRGLICFHGLGQTAGAGGGADGLAIKSGLVTVFADLKATPGDYSGWGNSSQLTKVASVWTTLKDEFKVKPDKFLVSAISMGGATALLAVMNPDNVTGVGPANIACIDCAAGAVNIDDIHTRNPLSATATIDTAYANAWASAKATHDPYLNFSVLNAAGVPMLWQYGGSDDVCRPQYAEAMGAAVSSVTLHNQGAGVGHDLTGFDDEARFALLKEHEA